MHEDEVKNILRFITNNRTVNMKDITVLIKKESRYTQAFLTALEGAGLVESETKGQMKIISLTKKGIDFLEEG